jgi:hypothetical protein
MPAENLNFDEISKERRKALEQSIKSISPEELKALGEGLFPYQDHPWREVFFKFIAENSDATFHHGTTHDGVHVLYCHTRDKGMWFVPGSGMGPLQARGLGVMKQIVEGSR